MRKNRHYLIAVTTLAVIALVFGVAGTVAPPLAEEASPTTPQQKSSPDSVAHFANPPTYDSGWVDIRGKVGQHFTLEHSLNESNLVMDITGKQDLNITYGGQAWSRSYGRWYASADDCAYSVFQTTDGGFALAGCTQPYGAETYDFWLVKTDSDGSTQWNKTFGGSGWEQARSLVKTSDEGYAIAGYSSSLAGGYDFWLIRTDQTGKHLWNRTYSGSSADWAQSVVHTTDGGYALAGQTTPLGSGNGDFWLVRLNPETGYEHQQNLGGTAELGWMKTLGDAGDDYAYSVIQTADGGYAVAGDTNSYGGTYDLYLAITDSAGNLFWKQHFGGTGNDHARSLIQTIDGGYVVAGYTDSSGTAGGDDVWLVKFYSIGEREWNRTYGGTGWDQGLSVVQTVDGGYAIAGATSSPGTAGGFDVLLIKTDSAGNHQWNKTYGGTLNDHGNSLIQTPDGGYAIAGYTYSYAVGWNDFYLVKTDSAGNLQWNKTFGGERKDAASSIIRTADGGYALAGSTESYGAYYSNYWLVKTDSTGDPMWNQTYGGTYDEYPSSVVQTCDNGFALAGYSGYFTEPWPDSLLVKTDPSGTQLWSQAFTGPYNDVILSMALTDDDGYILAGFSGPAGIGHPDIWLVKTDIETGLVLTRLTDDKVVLYRGKTDPYWNYVRVRIWQIQEPTWMYGDINMDGIVDAKDLYIVGRNYGKTLSLLSLSGIVAITGIHIVKNKRKESKQFSYIN